VKKIFYIFFILFITSKVHAVNVNSMTPLYWSTVFSPENEIKEHADLTFEKPIIYNNDSRWVNQIFLPNDKPGPFPVVVIMLQSF
jgi:hypothetical protein